MQHSPEHVNTPDLRRSCQDLRNKQAGSSLKVLLTCNVIIRLHRARQ